jgi:hypothetical protein
MEDSGETWLSLALVAIPALALVWRTRNPTASARTETVVLLATALGFFAVLSFFRLAR